MEHVIASNTYMKIEKTSGRVTATYDKGRISKIDVTLLDYDTHISSVDVFINDKRHTWQTDKIYLVGYMMYGIPVSKDGRFVFAQQDMNGLMCLDAISGNVVWKTKSKAEISHVLVGDTLLCCSKSRNEIQLIEIETGNVVCVYKTPFDNRFEVLTDDIILNHTRSRSWEILSAKTLEVLQVICNDELCKIRPVIEELYK